jgi:SAM-dependent methyltransferase
MTAGLVRSVLGYGSRVPVLREMLTTLHRVRNRHDPFMRRHPFDIRYGTMTSGALPAWLLRTGEAVDSQTSAYSGCQPSCLRHALAVVPRLERRSFVDLGCGKGRALILASELPFRRIVGVELAPSLVAVARRNAEIVRSKHPRRTAIEVVRGDAAAFPLPDGDLVIFLYHPFGRDLLTRVLGRMTDAVAGTDREIFLIYENPVHGDIVDRTEDFTRWHCETVSCDATEIGFAPDDSDTVVVWRLGGGLPPPAVKDAATPIVVIKAGWKAALATDQLGGGSSPTSPGTAPHVARQ